MLLINAAPGPVVPSPSLPSEISVSYGSPLWHKIKIYMWGSNYVVYICETANLGQFRASCQSWEQSKTQKSTMSFVLLLAHCFCPTKDNPPPFKKKRITHQDISATLVSSLSFITGRWMYNFLVIYTTPTVWLYEQKFLHTRKVAIWIWWDADFPLRQYKSYYVELLADIFIQ